jgi:hypothetical protein
MRPPRCSTMPTTRGDVEAQLELAGGVVGADELVVAQGEQLGVALLGLEQGAEEAQGVEVVGALVEHAAVEVDGDGALAELAVDRRGAQAHGLRGLGGEREGGAAGQQVGGLAALAGLIVEATELLHAPGDALLGAALAAGGQAAVPQGGGAVLEAVQDVARARGVAVEAEGQLAGLVELVEVVLALGVEGEQGVDEGRVGRAALQLGEHDEALEHAGLDRQGALQGGRRGRCVAAMIAVPDGDAGGEEGGGVGGQAGAAEGRLEGQSEALPAAELGGLRLDEGEQRGVELLVGGDLTDQRGGDGVPATDASRGAHGPADGVGVAGLDGEDGVVGDERGLGLAELVLEDAGLGQAQLGGAARLADERGDGLAICIDRGAPVAGLIGEADEVALELAVAGGCGRRRGAAGRARRRGS